MGVAFWGVGVLEHYSLARWFSGFWWVFLGANFDGLGVLGCWCFRVLVFVCVFKCWIFWMLIFWAIFLECWDFCGTFFFSVLVFWALSFRCGEF